MKTINTVPIFIKEDNKKYLSTTINIHDIEFQINNTLDKHSDTLKYYILCNDAKWIVSFNVDMNQFEAMCSTMFSIEVYQDENENSVIYLSNEIYDNHQWKQILNNLTMALR